MRAILNTATRLLFLRILLLSSFLILGRMPPAAALEGVYQGCWTDHAGNNYCEEPSYDSSSYSSSVPDYYGASGSLGDAAGRLGEAVASAWAAAAARQAELAVLRRQALANNEQGNIYYKNGDYDNAIAYYLAAMETLPNDSVILANLRRAQGHQLNDRASAAHDQGDYQNAIALYTQALEFSPEDLDIRRNLTRAEKSVAREKLQGEAERRRQQTEKIKLELLPSISEIFSDLAPPVTVAEAGAGGLTFEGFSAPASEGIPETGELNFETPAPAAGSIEGFEEEDFSDLRDVPGNLTEAGQPELPIDAMPRAFIENPDLKEKEEMPGVNLGRAPTAGEQLKSAAFHGGKTFREGKSAAYEDAQNIFDQSDGAHKGGLDAVSIDYAGMGKEALPIPEERLGDSSLKPLAEAWNQKDRSHRQAGEKLKQLESKEDKTPQDFVEIAKARQEITVIESEKQVLKIKIDDAIQKPDPVKAVRPKKPEPPPPMLEKPKKKGNDEFIMVE